jgi:hypothetical protein
VLSNRVPTGILAILVVFFKHFFLARIPLCSALVVKLAIRADCSRSTEMETISFNKLERGNALTFKLNVVKFLSTLDVYRVL